MEVGDLVKRCDSWKEWMKHNSWMTIEEEREIGIVVGVIVDFSTLNIVVYWPSGGISYEEYDDLEAANV